MGHRCLAAALLAGLACAAPAATLSPEEEAGRHIFMKGESPSGARIVARVGVGAGFELSGSAIACGNCHGEDGRGRAEGGIVPPNIQWSELSKPYGHHHDSGRKHGPFDELNLQRTLIQGQDPDGNALDSAMPRYSMSVKDYNALLAYLKKLETQLDTGLGAESIRIGTLLPLSGRLAPLGESLRAMWAAYFQQLNQRGGIHGRQLELVVQPLSDDASQMPAQARQLLAEGAVFAVLAPVSMGIEQALSDAANAAKVPVIGPLTLYPEDARSSNPYVFHLLPGIGELAQVLARHAKQTLHLEQQPIALWHPDTADGRASAAQLQAALVKDGWSLPQPVVMPARGQPLDTLAASLKDRGVVAVLVVGAGGDIAALAAAAARIHWAPHLLVPGPLAGRDIVNLPPAFRDRVMLAYPSAPGNQSAQGLQDLAELLKGRPEARNIPPPQVAAYGAGLLLVEGLKRTGRDLSRRKLLATLEGVSSFSTGLQPALSYNADRRIGAMGGYLVSVDLETRGLRPVGGWLPLP